MVKRYTVDKIPGVMAYELEIVAGAPEVGQQFFLEKGAIVTVDTSHVVVSPDGKPAIGHQTIFIVDKVTVNSPIPQSTTMFSDEAIPVGMLQDDEIED